jgi:hypothetical protein
LTLSHDAVARRETAVGAVVADAIG